MRKRDDRLEFQFDGDQVGVEAHGPWARALEDALTRRNVLKQLGGLAISASVLAGCGGSGKAASSAATTGGAAAGAAGAGKTMGLSIQGTTEYVFYELTGGLKALAGTKYKHIVRQAAFDAQKEISNIESFVSEGVDGLQISPVTTQSASRGALRAKAANIPVVNQLWTAPTPADSALVGAIQTDNAEGGKMIADYIMKKVPGGGKILVVSGTPGQGFTEQLNDGLAVALQDGWVVAANSSGKYVRSTSIDVTQTMLTAHPDAKAIVTQSAGMGAAVASYLASRKLDNIVHVSSDCNYELVKWMVKGWVDATRYFSPAQNGLMAMTRLRQVVETGKVPSQLVIKQPHQMITKADLDGSPPPQGLVRRDLKPSLGYYAFMDHLKEAQAL